MITADEPHETVGNSQADAAHAHEIVSFQRRTEFPGVEVRSLQNSARAFRCYSADFEFFQPLTWHGEIWHRRRRAVMRPGMVLSAHPSEVFLVQQVITPGAGHFLTIDAAVLHEYLSEHARAAGELQLRAFTNASQRLEEKLFELTQMIRPGPSTLEIQTAMVEFVGVMAGELLEESPGGSASIDADLRTAERLRECLHHDTSATMDLTTLAKQTGVSRFQALRTFKRRYGLPPHSYHLSLRLAHAQKALREGHQPVHVAAQYGFVDQSHLTRHFKRLLGVTPAQYARVGLRSRARLAKLS